MSRSAISEATAPKQVVAAAKRLGSSIRTARLRRRIRLQDLAAHAGITVPTLRRVESGALGTGLGAYVATLWALGLDDDLASVADPAQDVEGQTLEAASRGERVRVTDRLPDDF